jgi:hypothetical protein
MLLQEEMRRTLRFLDWQAAWWEARVAERPTATAQVQAEVPVYALKQAWIHRAWVHTSNQCGRRVWWSTRTH